MLREGERETDWRDTDEEKWAWRERALLVPAAVLCRHSTPPNKLQREEGKQRWVGYNPYTRVSMQSVILRPLLPPPIPLSLTHILVLCVCVLQASGTALCQYYLSACRMNILRALSSNYTLEMEAEEVLKGCTLRRLSPPPLSWFLWALCRLFSVRLSHSVAPSDSFVAENIQSRKLLSGSC